MEALKILESVGAILRATTVAPPEDRPALADVTRLLVSLLARANLSAHGSDPLISQNLGQLVVCCQTISQVDSGGDEDRAKALHAAEEILKSLRGPRGFAFHQR